METLSYTIVLEPDEDGFYTVHVPALPGCLTQGRTVEEATQRAAEAIACHLASLRADGEPIPADVDRPVLITSVRPPKAA
jgi:predicted RNase H-like HicB family nuclease